MFPYRLLPFSPEALASELSFESNHLEVLTFIEQVQKKNQYLYLKEYLGTKGLNALFMVIEEEYISKDFLSDYTTYYATCFHSYRKTCKRLHFFSKSFTEDELHAAIIAKASNDSHAYPFDLNDWYLGFLVAKPIAGRMIGTTVLRSYDNSPKWGDRNFWGTKDYTIHLFGLKLKLDSLAFQEQDSVTCACATVAIWAVLHKASNGGNIILKTPAEVTHDAGPIDGRLFPNKGLSIGQMCQAITRAGLAPEVRIGQGNDMRIDNLRLKKLVYAYSGLGIPLILIIEVPCDSTRYDFHAITISGHKQREAYETAPNYLPAWMANNIEKLYAHDDQWGPFARIEFKNEQELITPWTVFDESRRSTFARALIMPVYPKVRISYDDVEPIIHSFDFWFSLAFKSSFDYVWDIKVVFSESYKQEIKATNLDAQSKLTILTQSFPKYLWVATCYIGTIRIVDIIFDATDVVSKMFGLTIIYYSSEFKYELSTVNSL